jgi:hypothetical protein
MELATGIKGLELLFWVYLFYAVAGAWLLGCLAAAPFLLRGPRRSPAREAILVLGLASGPAAAAALGAAWVVDRLPDRSLGAPLLVPSHLAAALGGAAAAMLVVALARARLGEPGHGQRSTRDQRASGSQSSYLPKP